MSPSTLLLVLAASVVASTGQFTRRMTIKNVKQGEYLFASKSLYDYKRRLALTWVPGFDAHRDLSGQWDVTFFPHGRVLIQSVKYREYLYASSKKLKLLSRRVFTWVPGTFHARSNPRMLWQVRPFGKGRRVLTVKNVGFREYLFAGIQKLNPLRRYALTWTPGFDASKDTTGQWIFTPVHRRHSEAESKLTLQNATLGDDDQDATLDDELDATLDDAALNLDDEELEVALDEAALSMAAELMPKSKTLDDEPALAMNMTEEIIIP